MMIKKAKASFITTFEIYNKKFLNKHDSPCNKKDYYENLEKILNNIKAPLNQSEECACCHLQENICSSCYKQTKETFGENTITQAEGDFFSCSGFKIVDDFLNKKKDNAYQHIRCKLIENVGVFIVTLYPSKGYGTIIFNRDIENEDVLSVIKLMKNYSDDKKVLDTPPDTENEKDTVAKKNIEDEKEAQEVKTRVRAIINSLNNREDKIFDLKWKIIIEINALHRNYGSNSLKNIERKILYGLLMEDEAYDFVPDDLIDKRLQCFWSSRKFLSIYCTKNTILILNDYQKKIPYEKHYIKTHGKDIVLNYHLMRSCIAGLEHGVLILFERSAIIEAILEKISRCIKEKNIYEFTNEREIFLKDMINAHSELEEVSALSKLINREQGIDDSYKELQYYVASFSEEVMFKKQSELNRLMLIIAVITTIVSIVALIISIFHNE